MMRSTATKPAMYSNFSGSGKSGGSLSFLIGTKCFPSLFALRAVNVGRLVSAVKLRTYRLL